MSKHEVVITQMSERSASIDRQPVSSIGNISVKPPIRPGELFNTAILGRDGYGVNLCHVLTTHETTVFIAGSPLRPAKERETVIRIVADRIRRLVDTPEKVIELLDENPFPRPQ